MYEGLATKEYSHEEIIANRRRLIESRRNRERALGAKINRFVNEMNEALLQEKAKKKSKRAPV